MLAPQTPGGLWFHQRPTRERTTMTPFARLTILVAPLACHCKAIESRTDYEVEFRFLPRHVPMGWMLGRGRAYYNAP